MPGDTRYLLILKPVPPGLDKLGRGAVYRLRLALKRLKRDYGLICVSARQCEPEDLAKLLTRALPERNR